MISVIKKGTAPSERRSGFLYSKIEKYLEVSKTFTTFAKEESGEPDTKL